MTTFIRYLAYFAFALAAPLFWLAIWLILSALGLVDFPLGGDRACDFNPGGCPQQSLLHQASAIILVLSATSLTVITFIAFRKMVRRILGLPDRGWP